MTGVKELRERLVSGIWWAQAEGMGVPCVERPAWFDISEPHSHAAVRRQAAAIVACRRHCPVFADCATWAAAAADTAEPVTGVVGGAVYRMRTKAYPYVTKREDDCDAARLAESVLDRGTPLGPVDGGTTDREAA